MFCFQLFLFKKSHSTQHNNSPREQILASSETIWFTFSNTIVNCVLIQPFEY